jgi:ribosomal protein S18 acetylase RimI-like enzyme
VSAASPVDSDVSARAVAWRHAAHAGICDVIEPWAHGRFVRATPYPSYHDLNVVRVEEDPAMSAAALAAFADEALAGLGHRRLDFEVIAAAEALRPAFEASGWQAQRLSWMHHGRPRPTGATGAVKEVSYDAVDALRVCWHREDTPDEDPAEFHGLAREVALRRGVRVLVLADGGAAPVAFLELYRRGAGAEIGEVYVRGDQRGRGHGTALIRAAIEAAGEVDDIWICADDAGRPKELYRRLGFRPAWTAMEFLLLPADG